MIKTIFYEQDKEELRSKYANTLGEESLKFELNQLANEISVGEIYDFYIVNDADEIVGDVNLFIEEIVQVYVDDNFNYLISGIDEHDGRMEVKLSQTEFWRR